MSVKPSVHFKDTSAESNASSSGASGRERLGVLIPGMGAVASTFIAGVEAIRQGWGLAAGSLTQLGLVNDTEGAWRVQQELPLVALKDMVFGGWDIFDESLLQTAERSQVLDYREIERLAPFLSQIRPMRGAFSQEFVRNLKGDFVIEEPSLRGKVAQLRNDICSFREKNQCTRLVMVWCGSTEVHTPQTDIHQSLEDFELALDANDPRIAPSQLYLYAALIEGVPYVNGAPNPGVEFPCFQQLSLRTQTPMAGSDFKTGQTFLKTVLAPAFRTRQLGVRGWYSTNILGNRDGAVLDDPGSFRSKEVSKAGVLSGILSAEDYPELYSDLSHVVRINYYPPRGDNKEGWDNIDLFGWLNYPMQIKVNFLCRDSILAAPLVLDLVLLMDLAARNQRAGLQSWLSYFFKSPAVPESHKVEHDLGIQWAQLAQVLHSFREPQVSILDTDIVAFAAQEGVSV
jgi:myo-inositol-1-phosphate synthase